MKNPLNKTTTLEQRINNDIRMVQRMVSENLSSLYPLKQIILKYQDKIEWCKFSTHSHDITFKKDCNDWCEVNKAVVELGYKTKIMRSYDGRDFMSIDVMRYPNFGEKEI